MGDSSRSVGRVLAYVAAAVAAAAAWALLVRLAIGLGHDARASGEPRDWLWTVLATIGAAACLLLVLLAIGRGWAARPQQVAQSERPRPGAHRRE
ncbi:MAG TPA: hypothetical protein VFX52_11600 [Nocardioidaceae bacterium]|jgi:hypothetical protein|nr:hypothetical protein [Nocardioidaceae bacterium]